MPLLAVRLLLGAIYFFPGLHKLLTSGLDWALSDNLRFQLYWKWAQYGVVPRLRLDAYPWLLHVGGLFVLAFELSFAPLVLFRADAHRGRAWRAWPFISCRTWSSACCSRSLWLCYVALVDWRPLFRRLFPGAARWRGGTRAARALSRGGSSGRRSSWARCCWSGAVVQGARGQMRSYPFSCYPTFQWIARPRDARSHDRGRRRRRAVRARCRTRATPPGAARSASGPRCGAWRA